jgi:hypothetical protein
MLSELSLNHRMELRNAGPSLLGALQRVMQGTENLGYLEKKTQTNNRRPNKHAR